MPKLRFGEFEEDWKDTQMESVFPQIRNGFVGTATPFYKRGGVRYIQGRNIKKGKILNNGFEEVTQEFHNKQHKSQVREADILMVQSGHVGECAVVTKEFVDSNCHAVLVLSPIKQDINSSFCVNYFYAERGLRIIYKIRTGNTIAHILSSDLKKSRISLPSLPEQEKIAAFLTSVDDRINQLKRKKSLLQDYKKGAMQKLFSQELRFKDEQGKDFPDWEEKRVCDMFTVTRGKVLAVPKMNSEPDDEYKYPVFSSQTKQNGLTGYYNQFLFKNAITWTTDGANAGDVKYRKGQFYCTNVCGVLLSDQGYANTFVASALNTVTHKYVSYVGNPKLMNNVMAEILISVPTSIPEQTKIANFLSSLDQKIEQIDTQITQTQTFKKGLLQQMFV